jgi:hypothetical protein
MITIHCSSTIHQKLVPEDIKHQVHDPHKSLIHHTSKISTRRHHTSSSWSSQISHPPYIKNHYQKTSYIKFMILMDQAWLHIEQPKKMEMLFNLCASRPSRYVSVINDNHLVSLMNFNEAKVNWGPYIKIHQQSEFKWSISEDQGHF